MPVAAVILAAIGVIGIFLAPPPSPASPVRSLGPPSIDQKGDRSTLAAHGTLALGTRVAGGTTQRKIFTLRNTGVVDWISRWLCRSDDPALNSRDYLLTEECVRIPDTPAGATVDVVLDVTVANRAGTLTAPFKMSDGKGAWSFRDTQPIRIKLEVTPQPAR